jgi:hypothetical protein
MNDPGRVDCFLLPSGRKSTQGRIDEFWSSES